MDAIKLKINISTFVLVCCLFLWIVFTLRSVSAWELEVLKRRLQETDAGWTAGETSISHLSTEEFKQMLGLRFQKRIRLISKASTKSGNSILYTLPSSFDWRDYNGEDWITPIKNQQQCGSCYSFAMLGTLETLIKLDQNDPDFEIDLAEQYLVSCGPSGNRSGYDYGGCIGNYTDYVCAFLGNTGAPDESCFPYDDVQQEGSEPSCGNACSDVESRVYKISSYSFIDSGGIGYVPSPEDIKAVLVNKPVPCGFLVYEDFQNYTGGVYEPLPSQVSLGGHLVYVVGYDDSQSCWIVKNSWGTGWGESGFFKIAYNQTSESSLTWFGMDAVDINYGEAETTTTTSPSSTTSSTSSTTTVPITTTTTISPEDMPNLTSCGLSGWNYPIVPSTQQGTNTYNPETDVLYPGPQKTYIDFALCNENNGDTEESFFVILYIDEVEAFTAEVEDELKGKSYISWIDQQFSISEGEHTLKLVVDVNNDIDEANEDDNTFEMSFTWGAEQWPGLYSEMFGVDFREDLHLLRDFRDEVLLASEMGKAYVGLLYDNSSEIASLLLNDKDLRTHTASVIEYLLPEIVALLNGEEAVVTPPMISAIETFLDDFEVQVSPGVKRIIKRVKEEIRKRDVLNQLGIWVK